MRDEMQLEEIFASGTKLSKEMEGDEEQLNEFEGKCYMEDNQSWSSYEHAYPDKEVEDGKETNWSGAGVDETYDYDSVANNDPDTSQVYDAHSLEEEWNSVQANTADTVELDFQPRAGKLITHAGFGLCLYVANNII